ncbi:MAG: molybdenum cofactor biosynthesis protein A [Methanomassiliicoccales archaeon PtaU1.Bin030]|nr:MAG: molybdenum cofactor biosynthesis protein A [Methanomassiliicoccales archaeon PtaU1.Bin030]
MIAKESVLRKGLPKETQSLCPECKKVVPARIFESEGKVLMEKTCPEHGKVTDVYWSNVGLYTKAEKFAYDGIGVSNALIQNAKTCPDNCGLCNLHLSHTGLANLDLTNRCNMRCPICFANANQAGYVYEPSYEEVVKMLETLRAEKPVPCTAVQFSGGEPTVYPRIFDVIKKAKELKFAQVQMATNGIKLAEDPEFARKCAEAGLNTIYLQFDGVTDDIYMKTRARPMVEVKKKAIENVRNLKEHRPSIVLVPTLVKGFNDHQIGDIIRFAIENRDVVRGVNFQPVAFTGRIDQKEREEGRYTIPDLVHDVESQTGFAKEEDWYPVPVVVPISTYASALLGHDKVTFTSHPHCGMATYWFIKEDETVVPLTQFVDVEGLFRELYELSKKTTDSVFPKLSLLKARKILKDHMDESKMPEGLTTNQFLNVLTNVFSNNTKEGLAKFSWSMMLISSMHFQDDYNYDIERVKRCVIHYVVPDGRIIPFCAYNGGPTYRTEVEKKFSVPLVEWRKTKGEEYT